MSWDYDEGNDNTTIYSQFIDGLLAAPSLEGINLVFGFENRSNQDKKLPFVCFYFTGGSAVPEQRYGNLDPMLFTWKIIDNLVFEIWASSRVPHQNSLKKAISDQNAAANVLGRVLQALEYQRDQGLRYARGGQEKFDIRWAEISREDLGRGLMLKVPIDMPLTQSPTVLAPVDAVDITEEIVEDIET